MTKSTEISSQKKCVTTNKGKAVPGWATPGCSGGQRGFIRGTSQRLDREDGAGAKWLQNLGELEEVEVLEVLSHCGQKGYEPRLKT